MNKKQVLLVIFFALGIIFVIVGLGLNSISTPMTTQEIDQYREEMSKVKWCHGADCPSPPIFLKSPYNGIGQTTYYIGTSSLITGSVLSIQKISISRRFVPNWMFFVGTIMTCALLVVLPIRIPQIPSDPFCIDPLCPLEPYFTVDPSIFEPLLYLGIAISVIGAITCFIKLYR